VATIHRFYCTTNDDTPKTTAHNGAGVHLKLWDVYVQLGTWVGVTSQFYTNVGLAQICLNGRV